jgi:DNA polymerase-3 subunit delta
VAKLLRKYFSKTFLAPTFDQASKWIVAHAASQGINIQPAAAAELAMRLMGETKKTLPTLQAHQELFKLSSFAGDKTITKDIVEELTSQDLSIDLFTLLDNIGNKNKSGIIKLLQQYYDSSSEDDKALTIRLSALLADQFRSLLIVREAAEQNLNDKDLLATTGWKSGRLFIMKKLSKNFSTKQLADALTKFYNLDKELKNSTLPPRVVIDMIVATI